MFNSYVDKIYCHSLARRSDRRANFATEAARMGIDFQFWNALDGKEANVQMTPFEIPQHNITFTKGYFCQNISMRAIFEEALQNRFKHIMIFEDDVYFLEIPKVQELFARCWNQVHEKYGQFDLLYVGAKHMTVPQRVDDYDAFRKVTKSYESHAVIYSHRVFEKMLFLLSKNNFVYDHALYDDIQPLGLSFCMAKDLCFQYDNWSDARGRMEIEKYDNHFILS
jgi:GR25 family glycosyltransferase involved in LPS biosynthesis